MILSDEQKRKIRELFPEECSRLLSLEDVNELLDFLDEEIFALLDDDYEPTDASCLVERLRDEIHWDNAHRG